MPTNTGKRMDSLAIADNLDRLPVTVLKGVGPRVAGRLERLGLRTMQDVLFHLPLRYEDRTRVVPDGRAAPRRPGGGARARSSWPRCTSDAGVPCWCASATAPVS